MLRHKHPTGIITENTLVLHDLDILKELENYNLIRVNVSITSLSEETRRTMELRTATINKRLNVVKTLRENNSPVNLMMASIIPFRNSHEMFPLVKKVNGVGANPIGYTIVRLNGAIGDIVADW